METELIARYIDDLRLAVFGLVGAVSALFASVVGMGVFFAVWFKKVVKAMQNNTNATEVQTEAMKELPEKIAVHLKAEVWEPAMKRK